MKNVKTVFWAFVITLTLMLFGDVLVDCIDRITGIGPITLTNIGIAVIYVVYAISWKWLFSHTNAPDFLKDMTRLGTQLTITYLIAIITQEVLRRVLEDFERSDLKIVWLYIAYGIVTLIFLRGSLRKK